MNTKKSWRMLRNTDYGRPERKQPSLHGRKFNPNPKFLGTAEAYFVCHIGPIFQISLIYAFIARTTEYGCMITKETACKTRSRITSQSKIFQWPTNVSATFRQNISDFFDRVFVVCAMYIPFGIRMLLKNAIIYTSYIYIPQQYSLSVPLNKTRFKMQ